MALTPEDVVNKRFQPTKFREGYDQDEVDDFLDEIVVELRRLNQENDELRRKVAGLQSGSASGQADAASDVPVPTDATGAPTDGAAVVVTEDAAPESVAPESATSGAASTTGAADATEDSGTTSATAVPAARDADEVTEPAPAASTGTAGPAGDSAREATASSAANVLAMAQKLHDDYVAEGEGKREEIITAAQNEADGLVKDAQEVSRKTLAELEEKKSVLERSVEQLKGFERDYRARLRAYIEGQLRDLNNQGPIQDEVAASG